MASRWTSPQRARSARAVGAARTGVGDEGRVHRRGLAGGQSVSDESLTRCISRLRRLHLQLRIESVYGSGYRLLDINPQRHTRLLAVAEAPPHVVEAYLHAHAMAQKRSPGAIARAIALLPRLTEEHPRYVPARVTLASTLAYGASWGVLDDPDFAAKALAHLARAEADDPDCPGIHTCRAWLHDLTWRFDEAARGHRLAMARATVDGEAVFLHAWHLLIAGDAAAAVERARDAVQLQPYSPLHRLLLARALVHAGRVPEALELVLDTLEEHPDSALVAIYELALRALTAPGTAVVDAAWQLTDQRDVPPYSLGVLSFILARCGPRDEAQMVIDTCLACAQATPCTRLLQVAALVALGDHDRAAGLVQEAYAARCALLPMVLREPANAPLLADARVARVRSAVFASLPAEASGA